jgi:hypothetical protein
MNFQDKTFTETKWTADTWVRDIEFVDQHRTTGADVPVHVTQRVRINGLDVARFTAYPTRKRDDGELETRELIGLRIRNDYPVTVETNGGMTSSELLVSFVIHRDDCTMPDYTTKETKPRIGNLEALIPPGDDTAHRWTPLADDPEWIRVSFMVRTAKFTA